MSEHQTLTLGRTDLAQLDAAALPRITIVVPVYGDLPSLLICIKALRSVTDPQRHDVLLVNDCGPDADEIETAVLAAVDGAIGFRYERNDRNLGFVGTCNRAVQELDTSDNDVLLLNSDTEPRAGFVEEMQAVLYAHQKHGVVCARSNNATIASLPYRLVGRSSVPSVQRTEAVFAALEGTLPRWTVSPVAMGFCFLTKRELIRRFGLFDSVFAPGYGEENDYCLRIDKAGFRSVIANRALVIHEGSKSFVGERRDALRDAHQRLLEERYPFYGRATRAFMRFGIGAAERFADALTPGSAVTTMGIDIRGLVRVAPDDERRGAVLTDIRAAVRTLLRAGVEVEVLADPADLVGLRLNPAQVTLATEVTTDAILHVGVLLAGGPDTGMLATANRRYAYWAALSVADLDEADWATRTSALGTRLAGEDLARHSVWRLKPEVEHGVRDAIESVPSQLESLLQSPLADRLAQLEDRWRTYRTVDSAPGSGATTDAQLRRLRAEITSLQDSLSYRVGSLAVKSAKRLARRR
ncbi:hypothetical protein DEI86_12675 [Curtobacterium sp. MCBD17_028]|nr:hypothetical protein DEI86_12675 [Curtobacterium sp. MCBD17_028]